MSFLQTKQLEKLSQLCSNYARMLYFFLQILKLLLREAKLCPENHSQAQLRLSAKLCAVRFWALSNMPAYAANAH